MSNLTWQKSPYSAQGDSCVHVAVHAGTVHLTESADPGGAILTAPRRHPRRLRRSGSAGAGSRSKADWVAGVTGWLPAASVRRRSVRGSVGADFRRLIFVRGWGWPNFPSPPNGLRTAKDQRRKAGSNSRKSTRRVVRRSDVSGAAAARPGRADDRSRGRDLPLVSIWTARPKAPSRMPS
ncbi:DUF397 domain-containing protein [Streptomyces sp. NPDC056910]|uniref:DUF397 domain-containing protein n=1 Tax=Streptomyces sp. NPDC056910 TaxID=3345964 RepID=UPI003696958C